MLLKFRLRNKRKRLIKLEARKVGDGTKVSKLSMRELNDQLFRMEYALYLARLEWFKLCQKSILFFWKRFDETCSSKARVASIRFSELYVDLIDERQ